MVCSQVWRCQCRSDAGEVTRIYLVPICQESNRQNLARAINAWFEPQAVQILDCVQAFRQPPTAGVVHPQRAAGRNGSGSSISAGLGYGASDRDE